ncbi:Glycosyl transferase family 2 [Monaibacterium marinum]|uniref:Glycosyl transferase family 2 n=1 Tax=Pontivivens marinum TaxID=1690039 RepID=A0A2C9CWN3_9RHOB|nr:glycosyltransferase family A protein [Monaibacterium marinum]SOH95593.1 Glycosyl transferase family 2 [Monaibacterium marinum]
MRLTVGVPVYNGVGDIEECLSCIVRQTTDAFRIVISDNASTDGTSEICAEFARNHPNVEHYRHEQTSDATTNFLWLLNRCEDDLFMWRAHDDLGSNDQIEKLMALFADPACRLAVSPVETRRIRENGEVKIRQHDLPAGLNGEGTASAMQARLMGAHQSWFYGMWHRETLSFTFGDVWAAYPEGWGSDHLTLVPPLLEDSVRGAPETRFIQRIGQTQGPSNESWQQMRQRRQTTGALLARQIAEANISPTDRAAASAIAQRWLDKRIHSRFRILKRRLNLR